MQPSDLCITTDELIAAAKSRTGRSGLLLIAPQIVDDLEPLGIHTLSPEPAQLWGESDIRRATLRLATTHGRKRVEVLIDEATCDRLRPIDEVLDAATALLAPTLKNLFETIEQAISDQKR
jgi:hypothetical protein